jgi:prevent-host-death family protein
MPSTKMTSREFNQDTGRAKQAATRGPVIITDRGRPAHVLLTIEDYERLTGQGADIIEMLGMPGVEDVEFEPPRLLGQMHRPVDLS